jgi:hypothetical protein
LSSDHNLPMVTFSATLRRRASELYPGAEQTISFLQDLGEDLVRKDPGGFCRDVCNQQKLNLKGCNVIDGLRHRSLLPFLKALHPDFRIVLIYTEAAKMTRRKRWEPSLTELQLDEIDKHPVERELSEVREIADWIVCTDGPEKQTYADLASWFARHGFCRKKGKAELEVNISRGLLRSWIALSLLWTLFVLFTLLSPYGRRLQLGQKRETIAHTSIGQGLAPIECAEIRGTKAIDYFEFRGECWMPLETVRRLYPDHAKQGDTDLSAEMYANAKYPKAQITPGQVALHIIRLVFVMPTLILMIGFLTYWVMRGFKVQ